MITGYPEGSDISIMNLFYQYPTKDVDGNKIDDFMAIIFKDNNTGKKHHEIIKKPDYTFYKAKDGVDLDHPELFIDKNKVEPITVPYNRLLRKVSEVTGNEEFYKQYAMTNKSEVSRRVMTDPRIFFADTNIEDHYRFKFSKCYTNDIKPISKSFFDIEVDTRYMAGDFVEMGECPVNAISFHDEKHDVVHTYLLRNKENPLIAEFEYEVTSGLFSQEKIRQFIQENINGYKFMVRYKLLNTRFDIQFFDTEIDLLLAFYSTVHHYQPDFCESWNGSGFDIPYIVERIRVLGYEPADIMCDQSWEIKMVNNYVDTRHQNDFAERGDFTIISGHTTWIDQMIQFASRRKSKIGSIKSFKLDDIGKDIAKVRKLDYHHITTNIAMLPWLDFKVFTLYNIFDVIVQKCIEMKTQDLEYIYAKCLINNTSYNKGHRQTVYLINRMAKEFDKLGYVIGNNVNRWNEKPDPFLGALVPDPLNTSEYSKRTINGIPIWVCDNLQDNDFKSLYPSLIIENNIAPNTQIGRIDIPNKVYENENITRNDKYSRGGEFIENMVCDCILEFCHRWFHFANFMEFLEDWSEYNKKFLTSYSSNGYYQPYVYMNDKLYMVPLKDMGDRKAQKAIVFGVDGIKPLHFYRPYADHYK